MQRKRGPPRNSGDFVMLLGKKDKATLLSLFFLLFSGKQRGSCVCADTTPAVSGDFRGEEVIVRTASPYRMHLLISQKDIDS